jgi:hypothetical protein
VAFVHFGHSTPLAVSIILERSAVLAIFAMVQVLLWAGLLPGTQFRCTAGSGLKRSEAA